MFLRKKIFIKVSQRAAIDYIILPCLHWYNACVFILILAFMIGKKLDKIEKLGINILGGGACPKEHQNTLLLNYSKDYVQA